MRTVEQIMELVADYKTAVENVADYEARWLYVAPAMYQDKRDSYVALHTAIKELHKDAARLEWAMHYIPGSAWRHVGVNYNAGCTREDIDAAIDAAKEST